jgi:sulfoacetaldehyde dehydrogenase
MEDNIQEMYKKARKAFREVEFWPQEKVDEMVQAVAWELLKEDVRHKLGHMAVEESNIGNAEDKVNKIKNKTLGTLWDMRNAKTCGLIDEDKALGIRKFAKPIGVIAVYEPGIHHLLSGPEHVEDQKCSDRLAPSAHPENLI